MQTARAPKNKSLAKKTVDFMGHNAWAHCLFTVFGFFTVRLLKPVEYLLLRELMDCESILDLGCGRHSMVPILPSSKYTVGVELFEPHLNEAIASGRHKKYVRSDLRTVEFPEKSFDAVVMLDVLEHLTKEEGLELLRKMDKWAKKKVVIFTPNGFLHQGEYDENPLMEHRSGWTAAEFQKAGFRVWGVRGFKKMLEGRFDHDDQKPSLGDHVLNLTQLFTYHVPDKAFQLFCVKKMHNG